MAAASAPSVPQGTSGAGPNPGERVVWAVALGVLTAVVGGTTALSWSGGS